MELLLVAEKAESKAVLMVGLLAAATAGEKVPQSAEQTAVELVELKVASKAA